MSTISESAAKRSCSIIICTKDRRDDMQQCLNSLRKQTRGPDELIVVDSGSDDTESVVRAFARQAPAVRVVYQRSEPGLTLQRNIGIRLAGQEVLHFLDDDVILDPRYVEQVQEVFEADDQGDLVGVGPTLTLPRAFPRLRQRMYGFFMMPCLNGDGRMMPSGFGTLTWYSGYTDVHPVEVACGCCAYRRDVFERIGFDEFFDGYGFMEDLDFSYRAGKLGRMVATPHARMLHVESPSARTNFRRLAVMQIRNHHYVFTKHMPQDLYHWACFWWSELGYSLLRLVTAIRTLRPEIVAGMAEGYWGIVSGKFRRAAARQRDCG